MLLPFFYGWLIVAVTFVTMAIGVNARTAFSLFFPPFGFVISGGVSPLIGRLMDRYGPRAAMVQSSRDNGIVLRVTLPTLPKW